MSIQRAVVLFRGIWEGGMIAHRCDLCDESAECVQKTIEGREYDFCMRCWTPLEAKLKDKGRPIVSTTAVALPPPAPRAPEEKPDKPLPGAPPTILGARPS